MGFHTPHRRRSHTQYNMSGTRYFHYSDDAEARQKELEIVNSLGTSCVNTTSQ